MKKRKTCTPKPGLSKFGSLTSVKSNPSQVQKKFQSPYVAQQNLTPRPKSRPKKVAPTTLPSDFDSIELDSYPNLQKFLDEQRDGPSPYEDLQLSPRGSLESLIASIDEEERAEVLKAVDTLTELKKESISRELEPNVLLQDSEVADEIERTVFEAGENFFLLPEISDLDLKSETEDSDTDDTESNLTVTLRKELEDSQNQEDSEDQIFQQQELEVKELNMEEDSKVSENMDDDKDLKCQSQPAQYEIPSGMAEGYLLCPGMSRESLVSALPLTDECVGKQIEAIQERSFVVAAEINQLRNEISEVSQKGDLTENDSTILKEKQEILMQKLGNLNELTRKLERIMGLTDPSADLVAEAFNLLPYPHQAGLPCDKSPEPLEKCEDVPEKKQFKGICPKAQTDDDRFDTLDIEYPEDRIPRVIICGDTDENLPRIVVADSQPNSKALKCPNTSPLTDCLKKESPSGPCGLKCEEKKTGNCCAEKLKPQTSDRGCSPKATGFCENNSNFDKLKFTKERPDVEVDALEKKICSLQADMRLMEKENCRLRKMAHLQPRSGTACMEDKTRSKSCCQRQGRLSGGASQVLESNNVSVNLDPDFTDDLDEKLAIYGNNSKQLGQQLDSIESEVRSLHSEFTNLQNEKQFFEQRRQVGGADFLRPGIACPVFKRDSNQDRGKDTSAQQALRDLREQYARLQEDYKNKLYEVSKLRGDIESMKREVRETKDEQERREIQLVDARERLRVVEIERDQLLGSKEQLVEQEQVLLVAQKRLRDSQDELEELRMMIRDQAQQLDDYRSKYLQAQQQVEEYKRQVDLMEMDNARMNENVNIEINRIKNQFQEKLAELAPLPELLKQVQMKLQESQQMRIMTERNYEELSRELLDAKERIDSLQTLNNNLQRELHNTKDDRSSFSGKSDELEKKNSELRNENERLKNALRRMEEQQGMIQKRVDEKQHEIVQLNTMLGQVREDSARQVARTKERTEIMKKSMQTQINELELHLTQCRAAANAAQKERDEIRQKMQGQINNLNEAFSQAQSRIKSLHGHVEYLKVSYCNAFSSSVPQNDSIDVVGDNKGFDSCDCDY